MDFCFFILFLLQVSNTSACSAQGIARQITSIARTSVSVGDDAVSVAASAGGRAIATTARASFPRAEKFLRKLAQNSRDVPSDILPLLDDVGDIPLDKELQQIIGKSMSQVAQRAANQIGNPFFWNQIGAYLLKLKTVRAMDVLTGVAVRALREYEPEQLIILQRLIDDSVLRLRNVADDALTGVVELSPQTILAHVRRSAGVLYEAAGDKLMSMVRNFHKSLRKQISKPDVRDGDGGGAIQLFDKNNLERAEKILEESHDELTKSILSGAELNVLSGKFDDMIKKSEEVGNILDVMEDVAIKGNIIKESDKLANTARVIKTPWRKFVDVYKNLSPVQKVVYPSLAGGALALSLVGVHFLLTPEEKYLINIFERRPQEGDVNRLIRHHDLIPDYEKAIERRGHLSHETERINALLFEEEKYKIAKDEFKDVMEKAKRITEQEKKLVVDENVVKEYLSPEEILKLKQIKDFMAEEMVWMQMDDAGDAGGAKIIEVPEWGRNIR